MSTIVSSFVKDRASAAQLPTASLISGAAKAWAYFNQTATQALKGSLNVSGITDSGVGTTSVSFSAPMASVLWSGTTHQTRNTSWVSSGSQITARSGASGLINCQENNAAADTQNGDLQVWGDLA